MTTYSQVAEKAFNNALSKNKIVRQLVSDESLKMFLVDYLETIGKEPTGKEGWILASAFDGLADVIQNGQLSDFHNADFSDIHCKQ